MNISSEALEELRQIRDSNQGAGDYLVISKGLANRLIGGLPGELGKGKILVKIAEALDNGRLMYNICFPDGGHIFGTFTHKDSACTWAREHGYEVINP